MNPLRFSSTIIPFIVPTICVFVLASFKPSGAYNNDNDTLKQHPTLLVKPKFEGPAQIINQIRSTNVNVLVLNSKPKLHHTYNSIFQLGSSLQCNHQAPYLAYSLKAKKFHHNSLRKKLSLNNPSVWEYILVASSPISTLGSERLLQQPNPRTYSAKQAIFHKNNDSLRSQTNHLSPPSKTCGLFSSTPKKLPFSSLAREPTFS